mmetsp:Transcript_27345/g.63768  ORF Transcript_27345/g.63768 Transcript_27345/m.63768 type:complete len:479 (-) Transcript_27345:34-1470(-)
MQQRLFAPSITAVAPGALGALRGEQQTLTGEVPSLRSRAVSSSRPTNLQSQSWESHYRGLPSFCFSSSTAAAAAAASIGVYAAATGSHRRRAQCRSYTAAAVPGQFVWDPKAGKTGVRQGGPSLFDTEKYANSLLQVQKTQDSLKATVVDCGSGSTRLIRFSARGSQSRQFPEEVFRRKDAYRGDPLAKALQEPARARTLLHDLSKEVPDGHLLLGATAGVRHALEDGRITKQDVNRFAAQVQEAFHGRARFALLTGQQEARAEWQAVQHEWRCQQLSERHLSGMLSGGGMSCQLALQGDHGNVSFESVENWVLLPGGLVDKAGMGELSSTDLPSEVEAHRQAFLDRIAHIPKGLSGTFALVEWVGRFLAAEPTQRDLFMSMGYGRAFTRAELLQKLEAHLSAVDSRNSYGSGKVQRRDAVALAYGTVIHTLLSEVFARDAEFMCVDNVNWATGHFLLHLQHRSRNVWVPELSLALAK